MASAVVGATMETLLRAYQIPILPSLITVVVGGIVVGKCCGWKIGENMKNTPLKRTEMKAMETAKRFAPFVGAVITTAIYTQRLTPDLLLSR